MADWSIWVWVAIAVVALVIIAAIIFGTRRKDEVDPDGPFAPDQGGAAEPMTARRSATGDTFADAEAPTSEPSPRGRRVDETPMEGDEVVAEASAARGDLTATNVAESEDEETLTGPLAVPDDADTGASGDDFNSTDAVAPETADEPSSTEEPVEDFAAEGAPEPGDDLGAAAANEPEPEFSGETAAEPPSEHIEDDFAPDEPVVAAPEGMAATEPESHFEPPAAEGAVVGEADAIRDGGRAVEAVPETAPAPATEDPTPESTASVVVGGQESTPAVDVGSPDDNDPPEADFTPPRHAAGEDYGEPIPDVAPDDDVPRDDLGRRLDPYGNPVE